MIRKNPTNPMNPTNPTNPTNAIDAIDAMDAINAMNLRPKRWTLDSGLILWERLSSLDDHGQKPVPTYHISRIPYHPTNPTNAIDAIDAMDAINAMNQTPNNAYRCRDAFKRSFYPFQFSAIVSLSSIGGWL